MYHIAHYNMYVCHYQATQRTDLLVLVFNNFNIHKIKYIIMNFNNAYY